MLRVTTQESVTPRRGLVRSKGTVVQYGNEYDTHPDAPGERRETKKLVGDSSFWIWE